MKKLSLCMMTAMLLLFFLPTDLTAGTKKDKASVSVNKTIESADAEALIFRINEIKAMDMSGLTSIEKKQLRSELRSIKAILNEMDGGVIVISAGTLLLIILLIILFL